MGQGLEVSPIRLDFSLEPGSNQTQTLTVRNTSNKRAIYTLTASDWDMTESGEVVSQPAGTNKHSCAGWLTFTPALVELNANESRDVTVTINVPAGAKDTRWALSYIALRQEQEAPQADKDLAMGIQVNQTIGVFVTQSPRSLKAASAKVSDFQQVPGRQAFSIKAKNTGSKILDCNVYLVISDLQNATEQKLDPVSFRILPEGTIKKELALPADLKKGQYMVAAILDYGPNYPLEGAQTQITIK